MRARLTLGLILGLALLVGCSQGKQASPSGAEKQVDEPVARATLTAATAPDISQLSAGLTSASWETRVMTAQAIPALEGLKASDRVRLLVDALEGTTVAPAALGPVGNSYLSGDAQARLHLTRALGAVADDDLAAVRRARQTLDGEARDRATLALGYGGDADVAPDVRELLLNASDPVIRMQAAQVLGLLGDQASKEALAQALSDPYQVTYRSHLGEATVRPVQTQAAGALIRLGVEVELDDQGNYSLGDD